jgi:hypothetical protein
MLNADTEPRDALDVICVADLSGWTRFTSMMVPALLPDLQLWETSRALYGWPAEGEVQDQYSRWAKLSPEWDGPPNPIYILLSKLLRCIAWEFPEFRSMADYWNVAGLPGRSGGAGAVRNWPIGALGGVAEQVAAGRLASGVRSP